mgnify:CR=1 FL=1
MLAAKRHMITGCKTIGLLGGSFNPPHMGHVHITNQALKSFQLQKVCWLVSPGNPLKLKSAVSVDKRVNQCRNIVHNPYIEISDIENKLNTCFTAETLRKLFVIYPEVRFVWLMGADNLVNFHKWDQWTWIMENIPVGVMARPGEQVKAGLSKAAVRYRKFRVKASDAATIPFLTAPAWSLLGGPTKDMSSTKMRSKGSASEKNNSFI